MCKRDRWHSFYVIPEEHKNAFYGTSFGVFLSTMTVVTPKKENEVYRDADLYITYLPKKQEKSTAIYAVLFTAEDLFWDGLEVGGRYLPVMSMSEELMGKDNDGWRLTLTFQYYDAQEKEETAEIMKVRHQCHRTQ
uniref:phage tail terminator family protein n=1 Tax=Dialister sp. TaxID=1955814 RepID=UPI0040289555